MWEPGEIVNMGELWEIWNLGEPGGACLGELLRASDVAPPLTLSKNPLKLRLVREQIGVSEAQVSSLGHCLLMVWE